MTDFTQLFLPLIQKQRLEGLALGEESIHPYYQGLSLLNIPSSICRWLGAPDLAAAPFVPEIISHFGESSARKVIFILVDALGFQHLAGWLKEQPGRCWGSLLERGLFTPLTSVVPSTTSAALTTLWSGRSPAEHGVVGYELWLKEFGMVANMIRHSPMTFDSSLSAPGSLSLAGFQPENVLPWPTLGTHLAAYGIKSYAFQHSAIARSGLSRMFFKDVNIRPFISSSDLWINLRSVLEKDAEERLFAWVYWSEVDSLGHLYGPGSEHIRAEFDQFSQTFEDLFYSRVSERSRRDTLIILAADHGQIHTPYNPHYDLVSHPNLMRRLHIGPTGENRLFYLHTRPRQIEAVREYIDRTWPGQFRMMDPGYAAEAGLFGPGALHSALSDRIGDVLGIAQRQAYLWWSHKENRLSGRHGGLSPEEMLVPLLAAWL
jgi:hypothetical protein